MKKNLVISVLMTIATTILLGIIYPLVVTGLAQVVFPHKANGQLIQKDGKIVGSSIIGQGFAGAGYFHTRPSAAGNITPASAEFQLQRIARERGTSIDQIRALVAKHTEGRQFGFLGEPRVNVLELNLDLDERFPARKQASLN
jgi:K+-transporting ATPase ATPase C chain